MIYLAYVYLWIYISYRIITILANYFCFAKQNLLYRYKYPKQNGDNAENFSVVVPVA